MPNIDKICVVMNLILMMDGANNRLDRNQGDSLQTIESETVCLGLISIQARELIWLCRVCCSTY